MNKKDKIFVGANSDFAVKGIVLWASLLFASCFKNKKHKKNSKNKGFLQRTKKNYNTLNSLASAFYVNKLKKQTTPDNFPIKVEDAEIIEL